MKSLFPCLALLLSALTGCDRTPGVRTSQSAGGPGNAPDTERSPSPAPTSIPRATP
ncbi:hypothetical protein [Terrimicrobium sacchariphilum]|uniref:hypothetical protein n=1 Tax=Terrimicrobium sacchariphilum TaxID=690879 RepID=UPI00129A8CEE|nr:hypothetical protein [Terrimicrobium sacchariphilum]